MEGKPVGKGMLVRTRVALLAAALSLVTVEEAAAGPLGNVAPTPGAAPTSIVFKSSATRISYGGKVRLRAQLLSSGSPVKSRQVGLYQRLPGSDWQPIASADTDSSGKAAINVKPEQGATYAAAYLPAAADQASYAPSESKEITVSVIPRIGLALGNTAHGAIPGQSVHVKGSFKPALQGVQVTVRVRRNGKRVLAQAVTAQAGSFSLRFRAKRAGRYEVSAAFAAAQGLASGRSRARRFRTVYPSLRLGSRGPAVRLLQRELAGRGYWVSVNGRYGGATARAVLAFRKVTGMARTQTVSKAVWSKLARGGGYFKLRHNDQRRYAEADLSRQVLVLAADSKVYRILPMSSGKPSTPTVRGSFAFYSHQPGYNAKRMYYSVYFTGNYAVHGYNPVPPYAASHGCIRIPEPNAVSVYNWIRNGDRIYVYG